MHADEPGAPSTSPSAASAREGGAELPGYDLLVQAASGLMSLTGDPDGTGYRSGVSVFDIMTGLHAGIGMLAALRHRERTGEGQHVEVNLLSTALAAMANHSSTSSRAAPCRSGWATPTRACSRTSRCRPATASCGRRRERRAVPAARAARSAGPSWPRTRASRRRPSGTANREALRPMLLEALATDERAGVVRPADRRRACRAGPINTIDGGVALAERLGLDPVVAGRRRRRGDPDDPERDHAVRDARRLPQRSARRSASTTPTIRAWLSGPAEEDA